MFYSFVLSCGIQTLTSDYFSPSSRSFLRKGQIPTCLESNINWKGSTWHNSEIPSAVPGPLTTLCSSLPSAPSTSAPAQCSTGDQQLTLELCLTGYYSSTGNALQNYTMPALQVPPNTRLLQASSPHTLISIHMLLGEIRPQGSQGAGEVPGADFRQFSPQLTCCRHRGCKAGFERHRSSFSNSSSASTACCNTAAAANGELNSAEGKFGGFPLLFEHHAPAQPQGSRQPLFTNTQTARAPSRSSLRQHRRPCPQQGLCLPAHGAGWSAEPSPPRAPPGLSSRRSRPVPLRSLESGDTGGLQKPTAASGR